MEIGEVGALLSTTPTAPGAGRTYVPVTARTTTGLDVFGHGLLHPRPTPRPRTTYFREPSHFSAAAADFTDETAEANPRVEARPLRRGHRAGWRGEGNRVAAITLVWGRALTGGGTVVTAELAGLAVDQCPLADDRFTLIAPDNYRSDYLEVLLWDRSGRQLAVGRESLYEDDGTE